jgi:capsid protein
LYDPDRADQCRGVPLLASVVALLLDKKEYSQSTLLKAKLEAFKVFAIENAGGSMGPANLGARDANPTADPTKETKIEKHAGGETWYMPRGATMRTHESSAPGSTYAPFTQIILEEIACALSIPVSVLMLKNPTRSELVMASKTVNRLHKLVSDLMLQRLWNWRIAKAIKEGDLNPAPAINGKSTWWHCEWMPSGMEWTDPVEQSQAAVSDYNMGIRSLTEIAKARGREYTDILADKAGEIEQAVVQAQEINKRCGTSLSWRDLICTVPPGQVNRVQSEQHASEATGANQDA